MNLPSIQVTYYFLFLYISVVYNIDPKFSLKITFMYKTFTYIATLILLIRFYGCKVFSRNDENNVFGTRILKRVF